MPEVDEVPDVDEDVPEDVEPEVVDDVPEVEVELPCVPVVPVEELLAPMEPVPEPEDVDDVPEVEVELPCVPVVPVEAPLAPRELVPEPEDVDDAEVDAEFEPQPNNIASPSPIASRVRIREASHDRARGSGRGGVPPVRGQGHVVDELLPHEPANAE
ncbi:MAG: hypothetical protein JST54_29200 [Deltaproteobacteria bacterium]|nr:hypothetical protein [Deltaproteobacteria bacterium]